MGFLTSIFKATRTAAMPAASGSFSVTSEGDLISSTLPHDYPEQILKEITHVVIDAFKSSNDAGFPLTAITLNFKNIAVSARQIRGGAMIFLDQIR